METRTNKAPSFLQKIFGPGSKKPDEEDLDGIPAHEIMPSVPLQNTYNEGTNFSTLNNADNMRFPT